ncbi:MAG: ParB-like protein [Deltaproteobacteria bacterium]
MNSSKTLLLLFCLLFALPAHCNSEDYEKGEKTKVNPSSLHPTQFLYGSLEVKAKMEAMQEIMADEGEEGVKEYLKENRGMVVIGPKGVMWLVDGHHHAKALDSLRKTDSDFSDIQFYIKVEKVWDDLTQTEFEKAMKEGNKKGKKGEPPFVYLRDENGRMRSFSALPKKLSSMQDFPWRSLVWLLKEREVIETIEEIPFQEFKLAEYLQKHMKLPETMSSKAYDRAVREAIPVLRKAPSKVLAGFELASKRVCDKILSKIQ